VVLRGIVMEPVPRKLSVMGLNSSADARTFSELWPPTTSTRPSASRVAVAPPRGVDIDPVTPKVPPGWRGRGRVASGVGEDGGEGETSEPHAASPTLNTINIAARAVRLIKLALLGDARRGPGRSALAERVYNAVLSRAPWRLRRVRPPRRHLPW